jgi:hypothetical protein
MACTAPSRRHHARKGRLVLAPGCTLGSSRRPPDLSLLATAVPHQVKHVVAGNAVCFRHFILMFQMFHLDVAKVHLGCCICCNDNIRHVASLCFKCYRCFQAYVSSVPSRCCICCYGSTRMFQVCVSNISYVSFLCCKCFIWMSKIRSECCICCYAYTRMFQVFHLFQAYVVNILSGCFKVDRGVAAVRAHPWVNPRGFPMRALSCNERWRWAGCRRRGMGQDADAGHGTGCGRLDVWG